MSRLMMRAKTRESGQIEITGSSVFEHTVAVAPHYDEAAMHRAIQDAERLVADEIKAAMLEELNDGD